MVDGAHAAWEADNIMGVLLMDIKAALSSIARGRLIHEIMAKKIDGDLIRWTESVFSEWPVEMSIEGYKFQSDPVEAAVPQSSPVSPILFEVHTAGLRNWVEERV